MSRYEIFSDYSATACKGAFACAIAKRKSKDVLWVYGSACRRYPAGQGELFAHLYALNNIPDDATSVLVNSDMRYIEDTINKYKSIASGEMPPVKFRVNKSKKWDEFRVHVGTMIFQYESQFSKLEFRYIPKNNRHFLYTLCHRLARYHAEVPTQNYLPVVDLKDCHGWKFHEDISQYAINQEYALLFRKDSPIFKYKIPIPPQMKMLPRWMKYPVPFIARTIKGVPAFGSVDEKKRTFCLKSRLCSVCGQIIEPNDWIYFIDNERAIARREFFTPGMHKKCANYAANVYVHLIEIGPSLNESYKKDGGRLGVYMCKDYDLVGDESSPIIQVNENPSQIDWGFIPQRDVLNEQK